MSIEAITVRKDRPAIVKLAGGWVVQLSVHDDFYLTQLKGFKRRLKVAHPDAGGNASKFCAIITERNRWLRRECDWYAELGLLPPDGNQLSKERLDRKLRLQTQRDRPCVKARCAMCRRRLLCWRQDNGQLWCGECENGGSHGEEPARPGSDQQ